MTKSEEDILSWEEFLARIESFHVPPTESPGEAPPNSSEWLFRGQRNSQWQLETTLERFPWKGGRDVSDYYDLIYRLKARIETFTQETWVLPEQEELTEKLNQLAYSKECYGFKPHIDMALLEYLIFLRHHGFPSPLLDWSKSPYIAAFFAFHNATAENVAIWAFQETREGNKGVSSSKPWISVAGLGIKSHARHFLQQSEYTICIQHNKKNDGYEWGSYEEVIANSKSEYYVQDDVRKFVLDIKEREKVLKFLKSVNINSFSLFQTTDSLLDTLATEESLLGI